MNYIVKRRTKYAVGLTITALTLYVFGVFTHIFEKDFNKEFEYPYNGDIEDLVQQLRQEELPRIPPINSFPYMFNHRPNYECKDIPELRLVYIVKSAPGHYMNRKAIRQSWGFERRFSDVEIRRVFLIGIPESAEEQKKLDLEALDSNDIVQANYKDSYYNNTYKTMSGFTWAAKHCNNAQFYMFVDDDYYVSTKNVMRFIRFPTSYPHYSKSKNGKSVILNTNLHKDVRLYTGFTFESSPLRMWMSKWYISLEEYPYDKWPPYVTAGAYVLSTEALLDMYYASFYTKHFRFDDIYVGLLAYKTKIEPFHCDEFYFYKLPYDRTGYENVIASHGYGDYKEMLKVWTDQKSLGFA